MENRIDILEGDNWYTARSVGSQGRGAGLYRIAGFTIPMENLATITQTELITKIQCANKANEISKSNVVNHISDSMAALQMLET